MPSTPTARRVMRRFPGGWRQARGAADPFGNAFVVDGIGPDGDALRVGLVRIASLNGTQTVGFGSTLALALARLSAAGGGGLTINETSSIVLPVGQTGTLWLAGPSGVVVNFVGWFL